MFVCCYVTATTEFYTLSLHDALPIFGHLGLDDAVGRRDQASGVLDAERIVLAGGAKLVGDDLAHGLVHVEIEDAILQAEIGRSTRLNSSHMSISYAVFCLKKKKIQTK